MTIAQYSSTKLNIIISQLSWSLEKATTPGSVDQLFIKLRKGEKNVILIYSIH